MTTKGKGTVLVHPSIVARALIALIVLSSLWLPSPAGGQSPAGQGGQPVEGSFGETKIGGEAGPLHVVTCSNGSDVAKWGGNLVSWGGHTSCSATVTRIELESYLDEYTDYGGWAIVDWQTAFCVDVGWCNVSTTSSLWMGSWRVRTKHYVVAPPGHYPTSQTWWTDNYFNLP